MAQSPLSRVPILRVLIPFMVGVVLSRWYEHWLVPAIVVCAGIVAIIASSLLVPHTPQWSLRQRRWWIAPLTITSLGLGWLNACLLAPRTLDTDLLHDSVITVRLDDVQRNEYDMRLYATMLSASKSGKQLLQHEHKIVINTEGCDYSLQPGDLVAFKGSLHELRNMGNPDEFDYARYMLDLGIRYGQHIRATHLLRVASEPTWLNKVHMMRNRLQSRIFDSSLPPHAQQFVVATLLGNGRVIDPTTHDTFAAAGVSHILAQSGLHMGVIALILWIILMPLDYIRAKKLRFIITILALACYAIFTGLSPSVVRATIMTGIVLLALVLHRRSIALNALAIAALILIIYKPASMFEAGFQLSFVTVATLLVVPMNRIKGNKIKSYIAGIAITSVIAMFATIALTAWHFNSISLASIVTNVLILPLFPLAMGLNAMYVVTCAIGCDISWLTHSVSMLYTLIETIIQYISSTLPSHVSGVYVTLIDVCLYYAALVMAIIWIRSRNGRYFIAALATLTVMVAHNTAVRAFTPKQGIVVFNDYHQTQILSFDEHRATLWTPFSQPDLESFKRYHTGFMAHYGISDIDIADSDKTYDVLLGKRIAIAGNGKWKTSIKPSQRISTDIVIITKKFHGNISDLARVYDAHTYIISSEIYIERARLLEKQCHEQGIHVVNLKQQQSWALYQ